MNIRKYLIQNGFRTNNNKNNYDYLFSEVYDLPFKRNIEKKIHKEINRIYKNNKIYKDVKNYFKRTWV